MAPPPTAHAPVRASVPPHGCHPPLGTPTPLLLGTTAPVRQCATQPLTAQLAAHPPSFACPPVETHSHKPRAPTWPGGCRRGRCPRSHASGPRHRCGSWGRARRGSSGTWGTACPSAGGSTGPGGDPCCRLRVVVVAVRVALAAAILLLPHARGRSCCCRALRGGMRVHARVQACVRACMGCPPTQRRLACCAAPQLRLLMAPGSCLYCCCWGCCWRTGKWAGGLHCLASPLARHTAAAAQAAAVAAAVAGVAAATAACSHSCRADRGCCAYALGLHARTPTRTAAGRPAPALPTPHLVSGWLPPES